MTILLTRCKTFHTILRLSSGRKNRKDKYNFLIQLTLLILTILLFSLIQVSLILITYVGEDTETALRFIAAFSLGTLVLSLAPAYVFFVVTGNIYRRLTLAAATLIVLFVIFMLFSRGPASSIIYIAAGKIEVRQHTTARFVLGDHIELRDLDNFQWQTRQTRNKRVEIEAYQLFSMGDALLLCPGNLLKTSLYQLPRYSPLCLLVRRNEVHRKPPRFRYQFQTIAKKSWREYADHLISWDNLRSSILPAKKELF